MNTQTLIDRLGGGFKGRVALAALFTDAGHPVTVLNTYRWKDNIPEIRELQLRRIKPQWFRGKKMTKESS